ncbi:N-acetyltransferase [Granulicella sp. dw_53]|uniref:GNAT family N-acetyltransferase n=1 Tax=Granulicella sp. dw_53 TaxID=2719792 RepID=UPI001BD53079|nr:N-acetyltransferase [Granulicella sp. dw_53]
MEIVLRGYRETDLETLFQIDEACFAAEFRFDRESMRHFVGHRRAVVVVAEVESTGEIVGFVIVHLEGSGRAMGGYVVTLDVSEQWRRSGLAGRLMGEAEEQARESGAIWMGLHVFVENEGAIRFYERIGYVRGERVAGFYSGIAAGAKRMDAWVYRKWIG